MHRRSIPALAGERRSSADNSRSFWVYPRACGGTRPTTTPCRSDLGLSPRLRGNVSRIKLEADGIGSIPALAGERNAWQSTSRRYWVYPRACGGTVAKTTLVPEYTGLSPRLRGNVEHGVFWIDCRGSIPALAGERKDHNAVNRLKWVYPRACGGTLRKQCLPASFLGLSPRLRGNAESLAETAFSDGSIPALAGERRSR